MSIRGLTKPKRHLSRGSDGSSVNDAVMRCVELERLLSRESGGSRGCGSICAGEQLESEVEVNLSLSPGLRPWLAAHGVSLGVTTYTVN